MMQFLKKRWVYHSLIWLASFLILAMLTFLQDPDARSYLAFIYEPLLFMIPIIVTSYLAFWAKERWFDTRNYIVYAIAFILIVVVGVIVYEGLELLDKGRGNTRTQNVINFSFLQFFAVGLQYFKRGIVNQFQLQELRAKTAITELNALKAQINPHFLFNTLNNIYGMNQINPEKGSEMIMELSDVMRYHLEFSKQGAVKLEDEIQLLQSYITLERLRLRETCDVQIEFEDLDGSIMISPLLFIPFVENAFKHGTHPTQACFVHIQLKTKSNKLFFTVKNSIIENRKVVKTNIGLQNTKKRLALLFPNKYDLNIVKNETFHLVELSISL